MAKFAGKIGFVRYEEDEYGRWREIVTEKQYYGDTLTTMYRNQVSSEKLTDDLVLSDEISIVADRFAYQNFSIMKYVSIMGANWKITSAKVVRPRILLTIGGVYNGISGPASSNT